MNTMKVEHSVFIKLPAEEIFAYISNLENLADWSSVVISARKISSEEMLVGTTVRCTIRILGRWFESTYEVIECMPGRYLTYRSISSVSPTLVCFQCVPAEDLGTNVIVEETIDFTGGFLGFTETVIIRVINRQVANDLQTLKDLLEATASSYSNTG